jgi:MFS family permease
MTATEQTTPEPGPVSIDMVAAWRRRRQACEQSVLPPCPDDETSSNGCQSLADTAASDSFNTVGLDFNDAQRAGLAAMLSLAQAEAPSPSDRADKCFLSGHQADQSPTLKGPAEAVPTGSTRTPALSASVADLDPPSALGLPSRVVSGGPSGTRAPQEQKALRTGPRLAHVSRLPLVVILSVQACLSVRLLHVNSAFQDEALYLWAGHLEWAHWLHGTPIPQFPAYFSGAPVIYPPIAALADSLGGLTGARSLSLCFMLGATALLWGTTSRLYGRRAAFFAAGAWAVLGPTQFLGAFATFDAMSLFLIGLAAWCAVHNMQGGDATKWMLGAAAAIGLANATKYASILFDPVIIAVAILAAHPRSGGKIAASYGASIATYVAAILVSLVTLGGGYYWSGLTTTTLTRIDGTALPMVVLIHSAMWIGTLMIAAALGVVLCMLREQRTHTKVLLIVLASAGLLAPLEQAHIHTTTSLSKHIDFGAWFAAVTAGYAVDRLITLVRIRTLRVVVLGPCAIALIIAASIGTAQAQAFYYDWPNISPFVAAFRPMIASTRGQLLVETTSDPEYYLHAGSDWKRWSSTFSIVLPSGRTIGHVGGITDSGAPSVYARYIARGYFSLVALNFQETPQLDTRLAYDLSHNPAYKVISTVPYGQGRYIIWAYRRHEVGQ